MGERGGGGWSLWALWNPVTQLLNSPHTHTHLQVLLHFCLGAFALASETFFPAAPAWLDATVVSSVCPSPGGHPQLSTPLTPLKGQSWAPSSGGSEEMSVCEAAPPAIPQPDQSPG